MGTLREEHSLLRLMGPSSFANPAEGRLSCPQEVQAVWNVLAAELCFCAAQWVRPRGGQHEAQVEVAPRVADASGAEVPSPEPLPPWMLLERASIASAAALLLVALISQAHLLANHASGMGRRRGTAVAKPHPPKRAPCRRRLAATVCVPSPAALLRWRSCRDRRGWGGVRSHAGARVQSSDLAQAATATNGSAAITAIAAVAAEQSAAIATRSGTPPVLLGVVATGGSGSSEEETSGIDNEQALRDGAGAGLTVEEPTACTPSAAVAQTTCSTCTSDPGGLAAAAIVSAQTSPASAQGLPAYGEVVAREEEATTEEERLLLLAIELVGGEVLGDGLNGVPSYSSLGGCGGGGGGGGGRGGHGGGGDLTTTGTGTGAPVPGSAPGAPAGLCFCQSRLPRQPRASHSVRVPSVAVRATTATSASITPPPSPPTAYEQQPPFRRPPIAEDRFPSQSSAMSNGRASPLPSHRSSTRPVTRGCVVVRQSTFTPRCYPPGSLMGSLELMDVSEADELVGISSQAWDEWRPPRRLHLSEPANDDAPPYHEPRAGGLAGQAAAQVAQAQVAAPLSSAGLRMTDSTPTRGPGQPTRGGWRRRARQQRPREALEAMERTRHGMGATAPEPHAEGVASGCGSHGAHDQDPGSRGPGTAGSTGRRHAWGWSEEAVPDGYSTVGGHSCHARSSTAEGRWTSRLLGSLQLRAKLSRSQHWPFELRLTRSDPSDRGRAGQPHGPRCWRSTRMVTKALLAAPRELARTFVDAMVDEMHRARRRPYGLVHMLAWALNTLLVIALCVSAASLAGYLDGRATSCMCQAWLLACALTFVLLEPASVLLLAAARAAGSAHSCSRIVTRYCQT